MFENWVKFFLFGKKNVVHERILDEEATPAIRLVRHWPPEVEFSGNSWLGGLPALPAGYEWPRHRVNGIPLHHIAQIDLEEMPVIDVLNNLPQKGTLWFFANVSEQMLWDDGPNSDHSTVLYFPESIKGTDVTSAPSDLPEVGHAEGELTAELYGFSGPNFSIYKRWPIAGHETLAWEVADKLPKGVIDDWHYRSAVERRQAKHKREIVGNTLPSRLRGIVSKKTERTIERPDGTKGVLSEWFYAPNLYDDGKFPYNNRLALNILIWVNHEFICTYQSSKDLIARDNLPNEKALEKHKTVVSILKPIIASVGKLMQELRGSSPKEMLLDDQQDVFDRAMQLCFHDQFISIVDRPVENALVDLVAESMTDPTLLHGIPKQFLEFVEAKVLPSHRYADHFLLGPKDMNNNPTSGYGVRLARFDSDYAMRFMFCDVGIIDFWIDPEDLKAGRWDRAWAATAS